MEWGDRYQVSGSWGGQCVVDVTAKVCSCRRWELTGVQFKHVVAANWNMALNGISVGIPETWVHKCYWLVTWKHVYSYKIGPVNSSSMWPSSQIPIKLTPPVHRTHVGRPKKARKRAFDEDNFDTSSGKLPRKLKTLTCGLCGNLGHNSRTCKGQGGPRQAHEGQNSGGTTTRQPRGRPRGTPRGPSPTQATATTQPMGPSQPQPTQPTQSQPTQPASPTQWLTKQTAA